MTPERSASPVRHGSPSSSSKDATPGPAGPIGPGSPCGPGGPPGPAAPVSPAAPCSPCGPAGPGAGVARRARLAGRSLTPCGRAGPVSPCDPAAPAAPAAPAGPRWFHVSLVSPRLQASSSATIRSAPCPRLSWQAVITPSAAGAAATAAPPPTTSAARARPTVVRIPIFLLLTAVSRRPRTGALPAGEASDRRSPPRIGRRADPGPPHGGAAPHRRGAGPLDGADGAVSRLPSAWRSSTPWPVGAGRAPGPSCTPARSLPGSRPPTGGSGCRTVRPRGRGP